MKEIKQNRNTLQEINDKGKKTVIFQAFIYVPVRKKVGLQKITKLSFLDPDPGGVKSAKTEGKNTAKRQKIHHKKLTWCINAY
jgi:hypothetical protein